MIIIRKLLRDGLAHFFTTKNCPRLNVSQTIWAHTGLRSPAAGLRRRGVWYTAAQVSGKLENPLCIFLNMDD